MAISWSGLYWRLGLASLSAMGGAIATSGNCVLAQITPDGTLPNNSIVTPQGNTSLIEGGTQAGSNLFHSFEQFSVPTGGEASFNNALDIQNIISRVTGSSISNIDGLLSARGTANLFLLNPNGIDFGSNARLSIGGSFVGSTASSLNFADGTQFSATAHPTTPLLTVSVPIGLQYGGNQGRILVQGQGQSQPSPEDLATPEGRIRFEQNFLDSPVGLQVQPGKTLALVGGNVALEGGILKAPAGRIELGSVAGTGVVSLNATDRGFALGYEGVQGNPAGRYGDIQLSRLSAVSASGEGGGDIQVRGGRVTLTGDSRISANTLGNQNGGTVSVQAEQLSLQGGSGVGAVTFSQGAGGNLTVTASDLVELIGASSTSSQLVSGLVTDTFGTAAAGNLRIDTGRLIVRDGAVVGARTFGSGQGGTLTVNASESVELIGTSQDSQFVSALATYTQGAGAAGDLTIDTGKLIVQDGATALTSTFGSGQGGTLSVNASESVELIGTSQNGQFFSALATDTFGTAAAGNLRIDTGRLIVRDGAFAAARTFGSGQGGTLSVNASESVELIGTSQNGQSLSGLATYTQGAGAARDLTVDTGKLIVQDGASVSADTSGAGNGGNLLVRATDSVQVLGTQPNGLPTELSAGVRGGDGPRGAGGNLTIETGTLSIRDGGSVSTETAGQGNAGNLQIQARDLVEVVGEGPATNELPSGVDSSLTSGVGSFGVGNGGNLTISTRTLSLRDGGEVSAQVYGQGNGGDIQVQASELVEVVGANREGLSSSLSTGLSVNAEGKGGNVTVNTQVLSLRDGGQVSAASFGQGNGGDIQIQASELVEVVGARRGGLPSSLFTSLFQNAEGQGGNVNIDTQVLSIREGGQVSAGTSGVGNAGNLHIRATEAVELVGVSPNPDQPASGLSTSVLTGAKGNGGSVTVETGRLTLTDGRISADTDADGDAGNILVQASDAVELSGSSLIGANTLQEAIGNGGRITIGTGRLQLADQSGIGALTAGQGRGGNVTVRANESVQVSDSSILTVTTLGAGAAGDLSIETGQLIAQDPGVKISASTLGDGQGGNVTLQTGQLIVRDGAQVQSATSGAGDAGSLTVTADEVELAGTTAEGQSPSGPSGLFASSEEGGGAAGELRIDTERLIVRDGAAVAVNGLGLGAAGSLVVEADDLLLDNGSLEAVTAAGDRGNITVRSQSLQLRRGSIITTDARGEATGGNINIDTDTLVALENSDISANAEQAFGGRVTINAQGIFGTEFRDQLTSLSDITATSNLGLQFSGIVELNTPDVDPSQGLVTLPAELVDVTGLIAQGCPAGGSQGESEFIITGRGGLPPNPREPLNGDNVLTEWNTLDSDVENRSSATPTTNSTRERAPTQIVEANGWMVNDKGEVVLTASTPTASLDIPWLPSSDCRAPEPES